VRLLFAAKESYLPEVIGGGGLDMHHTTLALQSQGHDVAVIVARTREHRNLTYRVAQKLAGNRILASHDTRNGYVTTRVFYWQISRLLDQYLDASRPDVVIVVGTEAQQLAQVAVDHSIPVIVRLVTAECAIRLSAAADADEGVARLLANPLVKVVGNSHFVADEAAELLGVASEVDYPLIQLEDSISPSRTARFITFVNPRQIKGLDIALEVARLLPERRFVFAESYVLSRAERKDLDLQLRSLPNVTFRRPAENLGSLYGETALLMVPSRLQEAFGRVIIEACANGIPVVARQIGGIPEAMGTSGVLLAQSDSAERWAEAIEQIMSDPVRYSDLSDRALANAQRGEFQASAIAAQFLELARKHADMKSMRVLPE
jgi:glycosyltransferase involved in cell wall biosynthesis